MDGLEKVEHSAADDPFDTILVALSQRLPHALLLLRLTGDGDPGSSTLLRRVLLNLTELPMMIGKSSASTDNAASRWKKGGRTSARLGGIWCPAYAK